jgi:ketol-acid reductoisomerase
LVAFMLGIYYILSKIIFVILGGTRMVMINFGGVEERVVIQEEFPLSKAREILKNETVAVLGYGVQGAGQSLNMRSNGIRVIIGQRQLTSSWDEAVNHGWVPGVTLFPLEEAAEKGTIIKYLLSDAGQKIFWPTLKPYLTEGKTLFFSHGFSITYKDLTGVVPPKNIDVVMVAPKGSGLSLRRNFLEGKGINSSFAIFQDYTGKAEKKVLALGIAIGSGYLFPTTFEKEAFSDLAGERGVLMGAIAGIMEAQYNELRKHGHTPSEAFNETVEEFTESLIKLVAERGMDWLYANCSTTAQRGALDWKGKFREAVAPVFATLYESVANGTEAKIVLKRNSQPDYREKLGTELAEMGNSEMWQAGKKVRELRPENWKREA